jgi:hypothetical protein
VLTCFKVVPAFNTQWLRWVTKTLINPGTFRKLVRQISTELAYSKVGGGTGITLTNHYVCGYWTGFLGSLDIAADIWPRPKPNYFLRVWTKIASLRQNCNAKIATLLQIGSRRRTQVEPCSTLLPFVASWKTIRVSRKTPRHEIRNLVLSAVIS